MNTAQQNAPRLVVSGHFSPRAMILDVDPTFGSVDHWDGAMENVVDVTPEELEATEDYESWLEDEAWIRQGC